MCIGDLDADPLAWARERECPRDVDFLSSCAGDFEPCRERYVCDRDECFERTGDLEYRSVCAGDAEPLTRAREVDCSHEVLFFSTCAGDFDLCRDLYACVVRTGDCD